MAWSLEQVRKVQREVKDHLDAASPSGEFVARKRQIEASLTTLENAADSNTQLLRYIFIMSALVLQERHL